MSETESFEYFHVFLFFQNDILACDTGVHDAFFNVFGNVVVAQENNFQWEIAGRCAQDSVGGVAQGDAGIAQQGYGSVEQATGF